MKRSLVLGSALILCSMLVGCAPDTKEGLISDTIRLMGEASTNVGNITARVKEAVAKAKGPPLKKLDLSDAMGAAKTLKETGEGASRISKRIEKVRAQVTPEEQKAYFEREAGRLNEAFKELHKQKNDLQVQLAIAEKLEGSADHNRLQVQNLRDRIRDAESPFEALNQAK